MKYIGLFLLLLSGSRMLTAEDANLMTLMEGESSDIALPANQQVVRFRWDVPVAKWLETSLWKPESGPVPTDAHTAALVAKRWISEQPWAKRFQGFTQISLRKNSRVPGVYHFVEDHWFYEVDFTVSDNDRVEYPECAVILLDGTLIEPTVVGPPRPARK